VNKWAVLLLLAGLVTPARSAQQAASKPGTLNQVSVAQLDQLLTAGHAQRDEKLAQQISGLELTERLSSAQLARWQQRLPGSLSRDALVALADSSAFLDLPAAEIPAIAPPDPAVQRSMLTRAILYINQTLPILPNFFATRETIRFEDTPQGFLVHLDHVAPSRQLGLPPGVIANTDRLPHKPLHDIDRSSIPVAYRDGREVVDATPPASIAKTSTPSVQPKSDQLATFGEFGPILGVVFGDASQGRIAWSHWEQDAAGPIAVFHYDVPQEKSHFLVDYKADSGKEFPAYYGEIAIDPESGNILRITMVSDQAAPWQGVKTGIAVEYGSVVIGEKSYICPVRSVALFRMPVPVFNRPLPPPAPLQTAALQTRINDVRFTNYHQLRAESRIVTDIGGDPQPQPSKTFDPTVPAPPPTAASVPTEQTPVDSAPAVSNSPAPAPTAQPESPAPASLPSTASTESAPPPEPTQGVAQPPTPAPFADESSRTTLNVNANLVLVDVVVTKKDKPVHGLQRSQFHITVDGKEQTIASFDEHRTQAAPEPARRPVLPPSTYTNIPIYPEASALTVLLLDGLNTPVTDQIRLRDKMIDYLGKLKPGARVAIFTLNDKLRQASNFTTDIAEITQAIKGAKSNPQQSGVLNVASMDQAANMVSNDSLGIPPTPAPTGPAAGPTPPPPGGLNIPATTAQLIVDFQTKVTTFQTDMRVNMTLDALQELARTLSVIPTRKNVIWFSAAFPLTVNPADLSNVASYYEKVEKTTQLLSDARIAIYPVDARGLIVASQFSAAYNPRGGDAAIRSDLANEKDMHVQEHGSMDQIADDTGGKAYYDTNGLMDAVDYALDIGSNYYTIGYVPPPKQSDGQFHKFRVRLDGESDKLFYRSGYFADLPGKPSANHPPQSSLLMASAHGMPPATQITFQARVLPATDPAFQSVMLPEGPAGDMAAQLKAPAHRYVVDLLVDPHGLVFENAPDGSFLAYAEFALAAYDSGGDRVNYLYRASQVKISRDKYESVMAAGFRNRLSIDLPEGEDSLRIIVHDLKSDRAGSLEIPLNVTAK